MKLGRLTGITSAELPAAHRPVRARIRAAANPLQPRGVPVARATVSRRRQARVRPAVSAVSLVGVAAALIAELAGPATYLNNAVPVGGTGVLKYMSKMSMARRLGNLS